MLPITRKISQYNFSNGNDIKYIVMHDTGNYRDVASGNANYFCGGDRQSSAHFFVDETSIYQVVEEYNASWHCGDGGMTYGIGNHNSIGIEMCNSGGYIADATIKNTIDLVKYLMSKYGIGVKNVVRHYDASRKICPNNMSANNWAKWYAFKAQLGGIVSTPSYTTTTTVSYGGMSVLDVQKTLNRLGFVGSNGSKLVEDGISGANTTYAIKRFQTICGLVDIDGIVGNQTINCFQQILSKPLCGIAYVQRIPTRYIQFKMQIAIDGVFGNQTAQAVKMYQSSRGLGADGVVGNQTWTCMIS